jgi:hypothetical protein
MSRVNRFAPALFCPLLAFGLSACFHSDDDAPPVGPVEFANVLFELETLAGEVLRDTTRIALMDEDVGDLCDDGGTAEYTQINATDYRLTFTQCASRDFDNSGDAERLVLTGGLRVNREDVSGEPPVWTISTGGGTDAFFLNYFDENTVTYTLQGGYLFAEEVPQGHATSIPEIILERRERTAEIDDEIRHTLVVRLSQVISDVGDSDSLLQPVVWGFEGSGMRNRESGGCPTVGFGITTASRSAVSAEYHMTLHDTDAEITRIAGSMSVETEHGDSAGYTDGDLPNLCR